MKKIKIGSSNYYNFDGRCTSTLCSRSRCGAREAMTAVNLQTITKQVAGAYARCARGVREGVWVGNIILKVICIWLNSWKKFEPRFSPSLPGHLRLFCFATIGGKRREEPRSPATPLPSLRTLPTATSCDLLLICFVTRTRS